MVLKAFYFCFAIGFHTIQVQALGYRWEDYNGEVPEDAFPISTLDGDVYIGRVVFPNVGACTGILKSNVVELEVACNGYHKATENIKILCVDHKDDYDWLQTSKNTFLNDTKGKHPVCVGWNKLLEVNSFLGMYQGPEILDAGGVLTGNIEKGTMCYAWNEKTTCVEDWYFVLIYKLEGKEGEKLPEETRCPDILLEEANDANTDQVRPSAEENLPKEKPFCSDIVTEGSNVAKTDQINTGCIGVNTKSPPSTGNVGQKYPSRTNVNAKIPHSAKTKNRNPAHKKQPLRPWLNRVFSSF